MSWGRGAEVNERAGHISDLTFLEIESAPHEIPIETYYERNIFYKNKK